MNPMPEAPFIRIDLRQQRLWLKHADDVLLAYSVSTAVKGAGECRGSECTPRGWHRIRARLGEGCPLNSVFVGRRSTGERYTPALRRRFPQRDWILTRILWLGGLEPGKNRFGSVDSLRRFIYIHGTLDDEPMGIPASHGCVRMRNRDIVELFARVAVGTRVLIEN